MKEEKETKDEEELQETEGGSLLVISTRDSVEAPATMINEIKRDEIQREKHLFSQESRSEGDVSLPMSRVRTIMKSSPDIDNISQESLYLITKATEYFIIYLTKLSQKNGGNLGNVDYDDLSEVVERKNALEFLQDIIPKKIKYSEYLELMKKRSRR
ncbi:CHRAC1 [Lepeophtheirus salmonis]|uniref:Chromatin accessibility complex protein 1 n=1 Tax=Lepeophtheirus salmonis TaxID=72036 RepID=A0A7R8HBT3_LEPSM|nr:CHRAC1 [Lepeophtheirus salmonis]CAF3000629.1 CHRAC1 [Lepeophtheirus salmonis]